MNEEQFECGDNIESADEIAKIYAMNDIDDEWFKNALEMADDFYNDLKKHPLKGAIIEVNKSITNRVFSLEQVNTLLDNMIKLYVETEEFERCSFCSEIKKGINKC